MSKIVYLVGAFGCGKTTTAKKLFEKTKSPVTLIEEDDNLLYFLKHPDFFMRNIYYLPILYYKLKSVISTNVEKVICDSHPFVSLMYGRALFEIEFGQTYSYKNLIDLGKIHYSMYSYAYSSGLFDDYEQIIAFINLPYEKHLEQVNNRYSERKDGFEEEIDVDYLKGVRRQFQLNARHIAEEMYGVEFIEFNDLEKLLEYNFF